MPNTILLFLIFNRILLKRSKSESDQNLYTPYRFLKWTHNPQQPHEHYIIDTQLNLTAKNIRNVFIFLIVPLYSYRKRENKQPRKTNTFLQVNLTITTNRALDPKLYRFNQHFHYINSPERIRMKDKPGLRKIAFFRRKIDAFPVHV